MNFFLCGCVKGKKYANRPATINDPKSNIQRVMDHFAKRVTYHHARLVEEVISMIFFSICSRIDPILWNKKSLIVKY